MMAFDSSTVALLLQDEAMVFPAIVSLLHAFQLAYMANSVGQLRSKYKVQPPAVTGDPVFERGFRAQQNTLEFTPMFIILLWISAKFLNPVLASLSALFYIKGRSDYFYGYCARAGDRRAGFGRCLNVLWLLCAYSVIGLTHTTLTIYFNINIPKVIGLNDYIPFGN